MKNRFPSLYVALFLSGMSGLVLQTVWVRMLTRQLGSTTAATSTVLAVFMGGLALGGLLGGRICERTNRLVRAYALLELAIAAAAFCISFFLIAGLGDAYVAVARSLGGAPLLGHAARIVFGGGALLAPTILMGATLPVLAAHVSRTSPFQAGLGRLYAVNTLGAVLGVLVTGFVLLGAIGEMNSVLLAMALNLAAAGLAMLLARAEAPEPAALSLAPAEAELEPYPGSIPGWAKAGLFLSGFSALAYEVLWIRWLMLPLRTSIYSFSLMLGQVLLGIAVGSWLATRFKAARARPLTVFGLSELAIALLTMFGLLCFGYFGKTTMSFLLDPGLCVLTSFLMLFPVAVCFGWQFPAAVRCCVTDPKRIGHETGRAYAVNTLGTILGSLCAGFVLIPTIGCAMAFKVLAAGNLAMGVILLWLRPDTERGRAWFAAAPLAAGTLALFFLIGDPYAAALRLRIELFLGRDAETYAVFEDVAGTTAPAGSPHDPLARHLFVNGQGMTTLVSETKLMAHLPLALVPEPKKLLVICFGMGTTFRSAATRPGPPIQVTAVDIVPNVFDAFGFFHTNATEVLALPNARTVAEDGRYFLLTTDERWDVITIDPAPPIYSAGTVNLYSKEFLELCRDHLTDHGVLSLWLPPAPESELGMIISTFVSVFPEATLWGGLATPGFYLIGGRAPIDTSIETRASLAMDLSRIPDLGEWNASYRDVTNLSQLFVMDAESLAVYATDFGQVTDDRPYTEFPLWRGALWDDAPWFDVDQLRARLARGR